jgi:pimeloyl-ACP methyl ester carboxylesterase
MPFVMTSRGRFFYRQAGGQEPCLVFLHGNLGSSLWWRPVLDRLPAGWRGLAFDAIGFGHSERSDRLDRYTVSARMLDLAAFIEALALPAVHLVAHSTATPVAIEFALAYPARVQSLVLVGPVPVEGAPTPAEAYPWLEQMAGNAEWLGRAICAAAPGLDPASGLVARLVAEAMTTAPSAFVAIARGLDTWAPAAEEAGRQRLRRLTLPVLLICGSEDIMITPEEARRTLLAIPGANHLEVMQGSGHSPMLENPETFTRLLVEFVAEDQEAYRRIRDDGLSGEVGS